MPNIGKSDYVRSQKQTREHHCHWPGCVEQVPPAMFMCKSHWFKVPKPLQSRIWYTYRPGQEIDMNPSQTYMEATNAVYEWIKKNYPVIK